jgi:hypothetical protein
MFAGSSLPDISNWTFPYISVPTQNPKNDYAFFYMLYLENYNGRDREINIQIDKVSWHFISAIFFLCQFSDIHSCYPFAVHCIFLIMHHFYCVLSRIERCLASDSKGLESMFNRRGGNYAGLGVSEVPRWFIEHYTNVKEADVNSKKLMFMDSRLPLYSLLAEHSSSCALPLFLVLFLLMSKPGSHVYLM